MNRTPMTVDEASAYSKLSKAYLYKLIGNGTLPSYKPSGSKYGRVILNKEDVENFLFGNKRESNVEMFEKTFNS